MRSETAIRDGLAIWRGDPNTQAYRTQILKEITELESALYAVRPGAMKDHAEMAHMVGQLAALRRVEEYLRVRTYE